MTLVELGTRVTAVAMLRAQGGRAATVATAATAVVMAVVRVVVRAVMRLVVMAVVRVVVRAAVMAVVRAVVMAVVRVVVMAAVLAAAASLHSSFYQIFATAVPGPPESRAAPLAAPPAVLHTASSASYVLPSWPAQHSLTCAALPCAAATSAMHSTPSIGTSSPAR